MTIPGLYRHFKGGTYRVLFTARDSETETVLVIYHPEGQPESRWVRAEPMFHEAVGGVPRFRRIGD